MFYSGNDMFDAVLIQKLLECMMSMLPVTSCNELGAVISQDLARNTVLSKTPSKN
jgi:hypothetical protein